jgi:hypothetical protein
VTDDALRAWLPIGFGTALLVFVGISIWRGKFFEGWGWEMIGLRKWTYRRKNPVSYWFNIVLFGGCGLVVVGMGLAKLLGLAFK